MDQTSIQSGVSTGPPPISTKGTIVVAPETKTAKHPARQILERLADLRITVVLFALALVLVFWGTLAQVDNGVWTVVDKYFRSIFVLVPLRVVLFLLVKENTIVVPFPGGQMIGGLMFINLVAAHAIR